MDQLSIGRETGVSPSTAILRLKGPLTLSTVFVLEEKLHETGDSDTIIDLSGVNHIDSAGLGTILSRWSHNQRLARKFALTGVTPRAAVLLELTKFNRILPIFNTPEEAERSFSSRAGAAS